MVKRLLPLILVTGLAVNQVQAESLSQSAQSELVLMIQQLQAEVRQLRGDIETQQYKMQKLEREQLERYRDTDRRLTALLVGDAANVSGSLGASPSAPPAPVASQPVEQSAPVVANQDPNTATASNSPIVADTPSVDDAKAYSDAFALVRERRFDEALSAFEGFIAKYPSSERLANAYYWVGEVQLAQQRFEPAKVAFTKVVSDFADHTKRPDALYKLGVVQNQLNDSAGQAATFEQLLNEYPKSSAAGLARNYQARQ